MKGLFLGSALAFGLALAPMAAQAQSVNANFHVSIAPPAPQYEVRPAPPAGGWVWVPGFWQYNGSAYFWTAGRYQQPPQPGYVWVQPRWTHRRNYWVFVAGHWDDDDDDDDGPATTVIRVPRVGNLPIPAIPRVIVP